MSEATAPIYEGLTIAELNCLEALFIAEVEGALRHTFVFPDATKATEETLTALEGYGMVERKDIDLTPLKAKIRLKKGLTLPDMITVSRLTHTGRFAYCSYASTLPDEPTTKRQKTENPTDAKH